MTVKKRQDLKRIINLSMPSAEIGVAEGLFSKEILLWGVEKHYMVDLWANVPSATGMLLEPQSLHDKNLQDVIALTKQYASGVILQGESKAISELIENESLGFIYIDACHDYECVLADLEAWVPKVVKGGIVAGHDFLNTDYGVNKAVKEYCATHAYRWVLIPDIGEEYAGFWFRKTH